MGMFEVDVKLTGTITDSGLAKKAIDAIEAGLLEIATIEGQVGVQKQLKPKHGFRTGHLFKHIGAALVGPLTAQFDAGANRYGKNLIYSYWIEGVSTRNKNSTFKGFGMFKKTKKKMRSNPNMWKKYIGQRLNKVWTGNVTG